MNSPEPHGVLYDHQFTVAGCVVVIVALVLCFGILLLSMTRKDDEK